MPKVSVLQSSFNCGELSPLMFGRTDNPRYKEGLALCQNYIPTLQGPLVRRPGFKFMTTVKDSTNPPILIPYQFSTTQAYMLEFGANYIRFYANMGQIVTSGASFKIQGVPFGNYSVQVGSSTTPANFFATRATSSPNPNEIISTATPVTSGSILELGSPYAFSDLQNLRFTQDDDTLYIFHSNYPVYKLQRFGQTFWQLTQAYLYDGPYYPLNSYLQTGDSVNTLLTAATVLTNPIGGSASIDGAIVLSTGDQGLPAGRPIGGAVTDPLGSGQIQISTTGASHHGYLTGHRVYIGGVTGTTEANCRSIGSTLAPVSATGPSDWAIIVDSPTTFLLVGSVFTNAFVSGGLIFPSLFAPDMTAIINSTTPPDILRVIGLYYLGIRYNGILIGFQNSACAISSMGGSVLIPFTTNFTFTAWQLGTYSPGTGWPTCGTFHQNRLCLAGSAQNPQQVDGSFTGDYQNFAASVPTTLSVNDDNAFSFQLNSTSSNAIKWMSSNAQGLLAGTQASEWIMTPSSNSEALTPTNFNAVQSSYYGATNAEAIQIGNAAIYIQRANRKVREMNYFFQVGTFRSTDLTEISEHITLPTVTKIVLQKETQPLIWGIKSDGTFISLIYDRSDLSLNAGWTRHVLGGQSDSAGTNPLVYSEAVIPSGDTTFDQLWIVCKRFINNATVYTIEYMTKIFDDSMLQEDACQLDCAATYDNPITITGITNASPAVVSAPAHGFSNGTQIKITNVLGMNSGTVVGQAGISTVGNLLNELTFVVASVTTNTYALNDFLGNPINSTTASAYISGGQARALVTTITGLSFLVGETVGVLADGGYHPDVQVISGGEIILNYPAAKVQIGYRYASQGQLLRCPEGAADGTSIGKVRRTSRAAFMLHRTGDLALGTSFSNLIPIKFAQGDIQKADNATPLFSGIVREGVESAYDFESQVCFQQNSPLPGQIQAITSFMEEFDV